MCQLTEKVYSLKISKEYFHKFAEVQYLASKHLKGVFCICIHPLIYMINETLKNK